MKRSNHSTGKSRALLAAAVGTAIFAWCATVQANVDVAQQPLIVAPAIPPNILFILDDSGSMNWDYMPDGLSSDTTTRRSPHLNTIFYNPDIQYHPPVDAQGNPYPDADYTSAWTNGFTQTGSTDLSSVFCSWQWQGNWVQVCEDLYYYDENGNKHYPTDAGEEQNAANWYSYYRTRLLTAKTSMSRAFADIEDELRLGWGRINLTWSGSYTGTFDVVEEGVQTYEGEHRQAFYDWIENVSASGGTPLRESLKAAGEYFASDEPWDDGISCRQSYTILNSDGFWNDDGSSTGGNITFSGIGGNVDGTSGETVDGPSGRTFTYEPVPPFEDTHEDTLADVAMHYWQNDLRSGLTNNVPTSRTNPAFWQHMVTIGLGLGVEPSGLPSGWDVERIIASIDDEGDEFPEDGWPEPIGNTASTIADLAHAAVNSRGQFYATQTAEAFAEGIQDAIKRATERVGASSSVAANSTELETDSRIYQAQYVAGIWSGDLRAFDLDPDTGVASDNPVWSAADQLPAPNDRNIFSTVVQTQGQSTNFNREPFEGGDFAAAVGSEDILNYIRGDQSQEQQNGGSFRDRESALGSLINSQPVFVGSPPLTRFIGAGFSGADDYQEFAEDNSDRTPVVYIGGNDGMLHAFHADTGEELFAFVPQTLVNEDLGSLSDPGYEHRYFVDGELTVADVHYGTGQGDWRTVLVGTLGRGGPGMFALDVTDPNEVEILWDLDGDAFDDELGQNLGKPIIAQVDDGEWRVLLGNGSNASDGGARLISVGIEDGDITTILAETGDSNALSGIAAWDSEGDGFTDTVYAGDMEGSVWRFDLESDSRSLLFKAEDGAGNPQPITAAPLVGLDPQTGRTWVFVGTGRYLGESDLDDTSVQTWYGLIDDGSVINDRDDLVEREIEAQTTVSGREVRTIEESSLSEFEDAITNDDRRGWYIDLVANSNEEGERMVTPNQFRGNVLVGQTRIPDGSDPCEPTGRGFIYAINPFTGARLPFTFFDVDGDGEFTDADMMEVNGELVPVSAIGTVSSPNQPTFVGDSMQVSTEDGQIESIRTQNVGTNTGRMSWREIIMQ